MDSASTRRAAVAMALVGLAVISSYAVIGILHALVWEPLATVPGASLGEIYAEVERANESISIPLVVTWGALGCLAGAAVWLGARRGSVDVRQVLIVDLWVIALGAPAYFFASFGSGMALGDTFGHAAGHAPWGMVLYVVSAVAFAAVAAVHLRRLLERPAQALS